MFFWTAQLEQITLFNFCSGRCKHLHHGLPNRGTEQRESIQHPAMSAPMYGVKFLTVLMNRTDCTDFVDCATCLRRIVHWITTHTKKGRAFRKAMVTSNGYNSLPNSSDNFETICRRISQHRLCNREFAVILLLEGQPLVWKCKSRQPEKRMA